MASRASLNKVLLIGNLTRDPELRYTPSGAAVCTFGLATNRVYTASDGTKKEEAEFHRIVSWNKLAELCSQLLTKGRKTYVEGRLQTRTWTTPAGENRQTTEIVIDDMRVLDRRPEEIGELPEATPLAEPKIPATEEPKAQVQTPQPAKKKEKKRASKEKSEGEGETQAKSETEVEPIEDLIKNLPF